jgi:hypothetical protein
MRVRDCDMPLPTLVWGCFCQVLFYIVARMLSHLSVLVSFFVRPEGCFFVPTCDGPVTPRAAAVKDGRRRAGSTYCVVARPRLDGGEHGVTLILVGTATIDCLGARQHGCTPGDLRGACGRRGERRPTTLYAVNPGSGFDHDAVMRIGGKAPRRRVHSTRAAHRPGWASAHHHLGSSGRGTGTADGRRTL